MDQLNQHLGQVMDISKWTMYFSFDIMGRIAFSKDFYQLNEAKEHFAIAAMHDQMAQVGLMGSVPWLMHIVVRMPFLGGATKTFFDYTRMQIDQRRQVIKYLALLNVDL